MIDTQFEEEMELHGTLCSIFGPRQPWDTEDDEVTREHINRARRECREDCLMSEGQFLRELAHQLKDMGFSPETVDRLDRLAMAISSDKVIPGLKPLLDDPGIKVSWDPIRERDVPRE